MNKYIREVESMAMEYADESKAAQMEAYMKHKFRFLGLASPARKELIKALRSADALPSLDDLWEVVHGMYDRPYREMHYIALELCAKYNNKWNESAIDHLEKLIATHSWWDTVDWIAGMCGRHFERYPSELPGKTDAWNHSDDMWLQRVSIIFQLKYKDKTDWKLMQKYILNHIDSKEFFIQKAQGWALRQYSKFQPEKVRQFVDENPELSSLTQREATKYLK